MVMPEISIKFLKSDNLSVKMNYKYFTDETIKGIFNITFNIL